MQLSVSLRAIVQQEIIKRQLPPDFMRTVETHYLDVASEIARVKNKKTGTLVVSFNGSQGSGKSTITAFLRLILIHDFKLNTVELSIDDFYLTSAQRQKLAREIHPLFETRGVPGTHDVRLARDTLECLFNASDKNKCALPRFNKAIDNPEEKSNWPIVDYPVDIVLFEGWCNHAPVQSAQQLHQPINKLEATEDINGVWRNYANEQLKLYHRELFDRTDLLIYLQIPAFEKVYEWRGLQEKKLAATDGNKKHAVMDEKQLQRFIQHYERITRSCLEELPAVADIVLSLDSRHAIESVTIHNRRKHGV